MVGDKLLDGAVSGDSIVRTSDSNNADRANDFNYPDNANDFDATNYRTGATDNVSGQAAIRRHTQDSYRTGANRF